MKNINEPDHQRVIITIFLIATIMIGWQVLVEWPRRQHLAKNFAIEAQKKTATKNNKADDIVSKETDTDYNANLTREQRLQSSSRITIKSDTLHGSISLTGARFDDLTLARYKETLDKDSPEVILLTPNGDENAYFAQAGWVAVDGKTKVPDGKTTWQSDKQTLSPNDKVVLRWDNGEGVVFILTISMDTNYMFSINQKVENHSEKEISVAPYSYINRSYKDLTNNAIMHTGPLGVIDNALTEIPYKTLREKGNESYDNSNGWLGITDKYWLTAIIPDYSQFKTNFSHYNKNNQDRYQIDYMGAAQIITEGKSEETKLRLFAGAKEIGILDKYATGSADGKELPIPLFDRAVDFGSLYFLTKPLFLMLNFFYSIIGNFGLAIMMVTIVIKILMYPLANKSYKAMAKMRILQPELSKIQTKYKGDQKAVTKETLELYKRHRVNPASGCLPLLVQMPVFFALYKVLYVTIEMRHAPFFGWLKDLSAADSSNIFTGFGLLPWATPHFLHLGILPILYCVTMIIQLHQQPAPADPVQAKMMKIMPFFLLFIFASFPAGLVLYWVWSNILSILQQEIITLRHGTHRSQRTKESKLSHNMKTSHE